MTLLSLVSVYTVVIFLVQLGPCSNRRPITDRQSQSCMDTGCPLFRAAAEAHALCSPPRKKGARASPVLITQETRKHKASRQQLSVKRCSRRPRPTALHEAFLAVHPASVFFGLSWTKICWFIIFFGLWSSLKSVQTGHLFAPRLVLRFLFNSFLTVANDVFFLSLCALSQISAYVSPSCFAFQAPI